MTTPTLAFPRSAAALALALALAGCATSYHFRVDAIANPALAPENKSYRIVSGTPAVAETDLRFQEAARYVKAGLARIGLSEAPAGATAGLAIEVSFGIGQPRTVLSTTIEPVVAVTGGWTRRFMVAVRNPETGQVSYVPHYVTVPASRQYIGFADREVSSTVYEKFLHVRAREAVSASGDTPPREVWSVLVVSDDESDDLREYLPLMVAAGVDEFGKDTAKRKDVVLKKDDERIAHVKQAH